MVKTCYKSIQKITYLKIYWGLYFTNFWILERSACIDRYILDVSRYDNFTYDVSRIAQLRCDVYLK